MTKSSYFICINLVWVIFLSSCGNLTRYNGAQSLNNKHFKALEIHGAATLSNVTIEQDLVVTGSTAWTNVNVGGSVNIRGPLDATDGRIARGAKIAGRLTAKNLIVEGAIDTRSTINAVNAQFADIIADSDQNCTFRFTKSQFKSLTINGSGHKVVILNNSKAEEVIFENAGGIVKNHNSGNVKVVNGAIDSMND